MNWTQPGAKRTGAARGLGSNFAYFCAPDGSLRPSSNSGGVRCFAFLHSRSKTEIRSTLQVVAYERPGAAYFRREIVPIIATQCLAERHKVHKRCERPEQR